jgi:Mg2+ and Co2+ transporter CorA
MAKNYVLMNQDHYLNPSNYYKICFAEIVCMMYSTDHDANHRLIASLKHNRVQIYYYGDHQTE